MVSVEKGLQIMTRSNNDVCASITQQNLHLLRTSWGFFSGQENKANVVNLILGTEAEIWSHDGYKLRWGKYAYDKKGMDK